MSIKAPDIKYLLRWAYLNARGLCIKLLIRSRKPDGTDPEKIRSIVVIRIDRIGDVVLSLPAIRALQAIFPNAEITVLADRSTVPLLQGVPYIANVISYEGFRRSVKSIKKGNFDMAVDLIVDYSIKTALLTFFSGAKVRVGSDIESRGHFFNIAVKPDTKERHMSEEILDIVRGIGKFYKTEDRADWDIKPHLKVSDDALARAEDLLSASGVHRGDRVISIHPGGHYPSQCWMPEAFAELADTVAEKYKAKIVMVGGPADIKLIQDIVSLMKIKPSFIAGEGIDVSAAVIAKSDILICNNSGPLHIASALGIPTVSTMGPTVPHLWWPLGPHNIVVRRNLACSPCGSGYCSGHECMRQISVRQMEEAVDSQMVKLSTARKESPVANGDLSNLNTILVINLGGVGDVLLSTPALRALKNQYPGARIYFLGVRRVNEFVGKLPYIDKTINFDLGVSAGSIIGNIKTLMYLRRCNISLAVNMRTLVSRWSASKIKFLLWFIGPKITAGRDTGGLGNFFDIKIPESLMGDKAETDYDLDMVKSLGGDIVSKKMDFIIDEASRARVMAMLRSNGISEHDILLGIHPGGKPSHRWPAERFAKAMKEIRKKCECKFVVTGGDDEIALAAEVAGAEAISLAGKLNIMELGALIDRCDLFISNDTAPMHMAAVLRTPVVAIFGPGYLRRFDPRNISENSIVLYSKTECAPCERAECKDLSCLKAISVEDVVTAALSVICKENADSK